MHIFCDVKLKNVASCMYNPQAEAATLASHGRKWK